ncbi:adenylate cyclase [Limimonas halophila]|uniref:Adenylate cyclase n=1 Tax=Limimonas halophila TaxID=1082479 RepID=A0A1G7SQQ1_9PROT|nr:adenylate/guanylate cyclase domain-containing protein [Limimonas halophila]SDG24749.1 adenylate cyclase [Limimonas halophila]
MSDRSLPSILLSLPARLRSSPRKQLPARVLAQVREQQDATERLIGAVQLAVVVIFAVLYTLAPKTFGEDASFAPVPFALAAYFGFTLFRLGLAFRVRLPDWFLYLSIVIDMALLFGLIWSFHLQYEQPAGFYLKAPTLLYVFIFIALRALRFEARFVVVAGLTAAAGWLVLVGYVLLPAGMTMVTRDYVTYITSNKILLGAEFDKVISILVVTAILATAIVRARALLVSAVAERTAARELARFFSPAVAQRIVEAESLEVGVGEWRHAAIVTFDLRGFTGIAERCPPDAVMRLLADYQATLVPIVRSHGGSIDKFLGDGILATFDDVHAPGSYAADALRCVDAAIEGAAAWQRNRAERGVPAPTVNAAAASGRVVFGAVGERDRLEYTVIGDAVNVASKVEKHNAVAGTRALAAQETYHLAQQQGYAGTGTQRPGTPVAGINHPVDLVALA